MLHTYCALTLFLVSEELVFLNYKTKNVFIKTLSQFRQPVSMLYNNLVFLFCKGRIIAPKKAKVVQQQKLKKVKSLNDGQIFSLFF